MDYEIDDVTDDFRSYRDALHLVWNQVVRRFPDSEHNFHNIDLGLFDAMIGYEVRTPESRLRIVIQGLPGQLRGRVGKLTGATMHWPESLVPELWDLRFEDFFDWHHSDHEYRHFEFVETTVANWADVGLAEPTRVLVDPRYVKAFAMYPKQP